MPRYSLQPSRLRYRTSVEPLEARSLLSVMLDEFTLPSTTIGLAAAPDGSLWFPLVNQELGRMTVAGSLSRTNVGADLTGAVAVGPGGDVWFTSSGSKIGRRTTSGDLKFFDVPSGPNDADPRIAADRDGNLWFTEETANKIGRLTPAGDVTEFVLPTANANPVAICASPDGSVWFTEFNVRAVGRISTTGKIDEFPTPARSTTNPGGKSFFSGIAAGPDGNVWFTEEEGYIGRITGAGQISEFALRLPPSGGSPYAICAGPDGNLWFTDLSGDVIGRITPSGQVTAFPIPNGLSLSLGIAAATDGNIWFGDQFTPRLGRVNLSYTDLGVAIAATPTPAAAGQRLTYTVTVTNHGPIEATNVIVTDKLPLGVGLVVSMAPSRGTVQQVPRFEGTNFTNTVIAKLGTLEPGAAATVTIIVSVPPVQAITNQAIVQADESDRVASNDSATVTTTVVTSPSGGASSFAPVFQSKQRLYSGKGAKRKLTGFQINFSAALDLVSATARSHFLLSQPGRTKRSPRRAISVKLVRLSSDRLAVMLTPAKYDAKKPLQLTTYGLLGERGHAVPTVTITL
jgi:uncharacterized repeat protein (TIGR01451 family)